MEDPTNLAQGQNSEAQSVEPAATEEDKEPEKEPPCEDRSDVEPVPELASSGAPEETSELDVSASSEALSNMADSLANLAESSPGLSTSAIRKMAESLYALAQADTKVTNQALEKMADSLANLTNTESGNEPEPTPGEVVGGEGGADQPAEDEVTEVAEELHVVGQMEEEEEIPIATASIAEIIATTTQCEDNIQPQVDDAGMSEAEVERQAEALSSLVTQEDIVRIANSLAELAGKHQVPADATTEEMETIVDMQEAEGAVDMQEEDTAQEADEPEPSDGALATLEANMAALVSEKPNLRKRVAKAEAASSTESSTPQKSEIQAPSPKRRSYDADFKLEVVAYAARTSKNEASRRYMVDRKRIQDWTRQKDALQTSLNMGVKRKRLEGGGRKAKHPVIEEQLADWVRSRWAKKETVTREMIKREARRLHLESSQSDPFSASEGWLCRFMMRHDISLRSPSQSPSKSPMTRYGRRSDVVAVQKPWIIDLEPASSS